MTGDRDPGVNEITQIAHQAGAPNAKKTRSHSGYLPKVPPPQQQQAGTKKTIVPGGNK